MKRINKSYVVLFIMVLLFLILTSCNDKKITETNLKTPEISNDKELFSLLNYSNDELVTLDIIYTSFDSAIYKVDNIIRAEFIEAMYYDTYCEYVFGVEEQFKGKFESEQIKVQHSYIRCSITDSKAISFSYSCGGFEFEKGESFILFINQGAISVYDNERPYYLAYDIVIPVKDVSKSVFYGNQNIKDHSNVEDDLSSYENFIKYLNAEISRNDYSKPPEDKRFTTSNKIDEILDFADCVFEIEILEKDPEYNWHLNEKFSCKVIEQCKGNDEFENITVWFLPDQVKQGDRVVVAVNRTHGGTPYYFHLASKHAVYSVDQKDEILSLLG